MTKNQLKKIKKLECNFPTILNMVLGSNLDIEDKELMVQSLQNIFNILKKTDFVNVDI